MKRIVIFLFLALLVVFPMGTATGQGSAPGATPVLRLEDSLDSMGTTYSVVVYGTDRFKLQAAVELA